MPRQSSESVLDFRSVFLGAVILPLYAFLVWSGDRGGGRGRACSHDAADVTNREAAKDWGPGRPNHMINSGLFLFRPQSRPLKRSQLALAPPAVRCWDRSRRVRRAVRPAQNGGRSMRAIAMRFVFALGLLITLCASADAATVHRSKPPTLHLHTRQHIIVRPSLGVTAPDRFAVPGWTDEQTRYWLDNATSCAGCG